MIPDLNMSVAPMIALAGERLDQAKALAEAAVGLAARRSIKDAVTKLLEVEPLLYEVTTLVDAASLINQLPQP